jgi:hypothetical protein
MEIDSMTQSDRVREAYDQDPEHEWQRLTGGAQARLDYLITSVEFAACRRACTLNSPGLVFVQPPLPIFT